MIVPERCLNLELAADIVHLNGFSRISGDAGTIKDRWRLCGSRSNSQPRHHIYTAFVTTIHERQSRTPNAILVQVRGIIPVESRSELDLRVVKLPGILVCNPRQRLNPPRSPGYGINSWGACSSISRPSPDVGVTSTGGRLSPSRIGRRRFPPPDDRMIYVPLSI